jgi:ferritin
MVIKEKMEKAINDQINAELYSAYLYLAMSSYFQAHDLPGFANWMFVQYQEETTHGLKFYKYVLERSGKIELKLIEAPKTNWKSPLEVFEEVLKHEQYVTERIHNLVDIAIAEREHATNAMLQWYVNEQVEEEANATLIIGQLKRIGESKDGLYMLDKELAARTFIDQTGAWSGTPPTGTAA